MNYHPEFEAIDGLKQHYLDNAVTKNDVFIFLCGGASVDQAIYRKRLGNEIASASKNYQYHVVTPEDIFIEHIIGNPSLDLLGLENLLAESVDSIVIPIESPGTFTELGAFSNIDTLKNKLIVLGDRKYKSQNSFINKGPLKNIRLNTDSEIIWYTDRNDPALVQSIRDYSRVFKGKNPASVALDNPITSTHFYQALIYVIAPISVTTLKDIMGLHSGLDRGKLDLTIEVTLNSLKAKGIIQVNHGTINLIESRTSDFFSALSGDIKVTQKKYLSNLRLQYLNRSLRKEGHRPGNGVIA